MKKALLLVNFHTGVHDVYCCMYCSNAQNVVKNIVDYSSSVDHTVVVNDYHTPSDHEFKLMPPHCVVRGFRTPLLMDEYIDISSTKEVHTKNKFSAIRNDHVLNLIKSYDEVILAGFVAQIDIVPTWFDLVHNEINVKILKSGIDDLNKEYLDRTIKYLSFLGVDWL